MISTLKSGKETCVEVDIKGMFDGIACKYDLLNHLLSFGIDRYWRRRASKIVKSYNPKELLDIATGTADLAIETARVLKNSQITGVDISSSMLKIGRQKVDNLNLSHKIKLLLACAEALPFSDNSIDAVTIGFGIRNFKNISAGLAECHRILKKGGVLCVLEFSEPQHALIKNSYNFYFSKIIPRVGGRISQNNFAYNYLRDSVAEFPSGLDFVKILMQAGFKDAQFEPLSFGIATVYTALKK